MGINRLNPALFNTSVAPIHPSSGASGVPDDGEEETALIIRVEAFSITIATGISGTDTITGFTKARTALFVTGLTNTQSTDDLDNSKTKVVLTNDTTITASKQASETTLTITGYAVEFGSSYVKEVHHGTVTNTTSNSQVSGTFDAVLANCAPLHCGNDTTTADDQYADGITRIVLSGSDSAVSVTATKGATGDTLITSFQILEFEPSKINQIQETAINMTTEVTKTATITAVNLSRCLTLWAGTETDNTSGTTQDDSFCIGELASTTTTSATRRANTGNTTTGLTVVEFSDDALTSVERIVAEFGDAETTHSVTLGTTLTDTSTAFISKLGWNTDDVNDWDARVYQNTTLITSTTNVDMVRLLAVETRVPTNSFEVYQG